MASLLSHHVMPFLAVIGLMLAASVQAYMMHHGMGNFWGGGYNYDDDFYDNGYYDQPLILSCSNKVVDPVTGKVTDALAVTIIQKEDQDDDYYGHGFGGGIGFDPLFGMGMGVGMGHNPWGGSYGHFGGGGKVGGHGQRRSGGSLKAEFQILSSGHGTASIVFTERARSEDGCSYQNFGNILQPPRARDDHYGYSYGFDEDRYNGVAKGGIKINKNLQTVYIDELKGFTSIEQLAGRGVMLCSGSDYDWDWEATCDGPYFGCCALKYDDRGQSLNVGYPENKVSVYGA